MLHTEQIDQHLADLKACLADELVNYLVINVRQQRLYLLDQQKVLKDYPVSTSRHGVGSEENSYKTPLGVHSIAEKIGAGEPENTIFKARQSTGELAIINSADSQQVDMITSRILWLQGEQQGLNCGSNVDSYQRYIYIHGTADEASIGQPASIGCIRMLNADIIELFDSVTVKTPVVISNN